MSRIFIRNSLKHGFDRHCVASDLRQASAISSSANAPAGSILPTKSRTNSFFRSSTMYSTGDLPSIRASISIRSKRPIREPRFPSNRSARPAPVLRPAHAGQSKIILAPRRPVERFQKKMIQQESRIERRISKPGRFAIEQHQSLPADENILGAEITMHQRQRRPAQPLRLLLEQAPQLRMTRAGREKVRLRPGGQRNLARSEIVASTSESLHDAA